MIQDKIKLYCGKIDEDKFIIMFSLIFSKFNFHFAFFPSNWKEFYYEKDGKKFIDNDIRYCLSLGIFQFIVHDFTGIDIIHIIVDEDHDYYAPQQRYYIYKFIALLYSIVCNNDKTSIPCTFNYSIKENGHLIFYLTINRNWLIFNNLGALTTVRFPDCYLEKNMIDYYFPKYNKRKTLNNYINYIKNKYFEGEA